MRCGASVFCKIKGRGVGKSSAEMSFCTKKSPCSNKMYAKRGVIISNMVDFIIFLQKVFARHEKNNTFATCIEN